MFFNGFKRIFLVGRYADSVTVATVLTLVFGFLLSLAYLFPPAGLLSLIVLFYSLKYLWLYDGTNFRWRNMKAPERAGTLGALLGLGMSLPYLSGLKEPVFAPITWLGLPLGVVVVFFVYTFTHPERRISLEDFFIAGWTTGSLGAISIVLLSLWTFSLHSPQKLFVIFSGTFFTATFQAFIHLFVAVGAALAVGYARKNFGWGGMLVVSLVAFGVYTYIFQTMV